MKLRANPTTAIAHQARAGRGELKTTSTVGIIEDLRAGISAAAAKARKRATRRNAVPDNGPTPERLAKATHGVKETAALRQEGAAPAARAIQIQSPVDSYEAALPRDLVAAARAYLHDCLLASTETRITASYQPFVDRSIRPGEGGLNDWQRRAHSTIVLVRSTFHAEFIRVLDALVVEVVRTADGRAAGFADVAEPISPWRDRNTLKGVGFGAFYMSLARLSEFYSRERALMSADALAARQTAITSAIQLARERRGSRQDT